MKTAELGLTQNARTCLNAKRKLQARAIKDAGGWRLTELTLELSPNQTNISTSCRDLCIIRAQGFDRVKAVLRQYASRS
jgi:hypothetical protein